MKKVLLTGANGQVGREIHNYIPDSFSFISLDKQALDITSKESIKNAFKHHNPNYVINAAAYTAVDKAETEPDLAYAVNSSGVLNLAEECKQKKIPLIHISTDYVFDGTSKIPYKEDDPVSPLGVYGKSKFAGEEAVRKTIEKYIILRTSWVFSKHGNNFVNTMLKLFKERETVKVVDDQIGCPTDASDIAKCIWQILKNPNKNWGTYHFCGESAMSWYQFANNILASIKDKSDLKIKEIIPIKTKDFPTLAKRPSFSVLNCEKINYIL